MQGRINTGRNCAHNAGNGTSGGHTVNFNLTY